MAKTSGATRKLIEFDEETWNTLDLFARESMRSIQELADEAFRDLLRKHGRPSDLKAALRQSVKDGARSSDDAEAPAPGKTPMKKKAAKKAAKKAG